MRRPLLLLAFLIAVAPALADTIVLKNGRRIIARNVVEEGDKVSYDVSAGRMSLPRSIVARIEHGGADVPEEAPGKEVKRVDVTPPRIESNRNYDAGIAAAAVHDGSVDQNYIATLEKLAQGGRKDAVARVVVAHNAAAQFLLDKGEVDGAIEHCRRALTFAPEDLDSLVNVSYLYLQRSEYTTALDFLERARRVGPDSEEVAKLTGWAYYGTNRLEDAIAEWKRALTLAADPEVDEALAKAQRDQKVESSYREGESAHFTLRYDGAADPGLARSILHTLEDDYTDIESQLNYSPREPIAVILYTEEAFMDVTRAPGWVGALNDGRMRIPVEGLDSVTPDLAHVLKHELTHSFVYQKTYGRCPHWVQEGIAQWMEGERSSEYAQDLVTGYEESQKEESGAPMLARLEGPWEQLPEEVVRFAYAWSLAAVEMIVATGGVSDLERLLDHIATDSSTETALRETVHMDYADLEQSTAEFLRRTYLR